MNLSFTFHSNPQHLWLVNINLCLANPQKGHTNSKIERHTKILELSRSQNLRGTVMDPRSALVTPRISFTLSVRHQCVGLSFKNNTGFTNIKLFKKKYIYKKMNQDQQPSYQFHKIKLAQWARGSIWSNICFIKENSAENPSLT